MYIIMYICLKLLLIFFLVKIVIYFIKVCYKHKYYQNQSIILGTNMIMSITKISTPMVQQRRYRNSTEKVPYDLF